MPWLWVQKCNVSKSHILEQYSWLALAVGKTILTELLWFFATCGKVKKKTVYAGTFFPAKKQGVFHPVAKNANLGVAKSSTTFSCSKCGKVTTVGWQVTLCDPKRHVISRSGVVISITNCYINFTSLVDFMSPLKVKLQLKLSVTQ